MISEQGWKAVDTVSSWLKYGFGAATTALSLVSLRYEVTRKTKDPSLRKPLTGVGRLYQSGVVLLATLTLAATIVGDRADLHEKDADKQRLNDFIAAGNKKLLDSLDPDIVAVRDRVSKTTEGIKKDLLEENQTSTKIQQAQQDLLKATTTTSSQIAGLGDSVAKTSQRIANDLEETETSILDANLRVSWFVVDLYVPNKAPGADATGSIRNENQFDFLETNPQNLTPDYRAWSESLNNEEAKTCATTPSSVVLRRPGSELIPNDPKNLCDSVERRNRYLFGTNELAKWLFFESGTSATLGLHLKGGGLDQSTWNCAVTSVGRAPMAIPCIQTALFLNNHPEDFNDRDPLAPAVKWLYPFALSDARNNILEEIQFDSTTGLSEDGLPLVRDLELTTIDINVCSLGDPAKDETEKALEDRMLRYLSRMPATLTVKMHESVLDEKANGGSSPSRGNSDVYRTYEFVRSSVERRLACSSAFYYRE